MTDGYCWCLAVSEHVYRAVELLAAQVARLGVEEQLLRPRFETRYISAYEGYTQVVLKLTDSKLPVLHFERRWRASYLPENIGWRSSHSIFDVVHVYLEGISRLCQRARSGSELALLVNTLREVAYFAKRYGTSIENVAEHCVEADVEDVVSMEQHCVQLCVDDYCREYPVDKAVYERLRILAQLLDIDCEESSSFRYLGMALHSRYFMRRHVLTLILSPQWLTSMYEKIFGEQMMKLRQAE